MKNIFLRLTALIFILICLNGCAKEEFMDLYGFSEGFTFSDLTAEDFYTEKDMDGNMIYYTFFDENSSDVMLKLICTQEGKTKEIRIFLPKYDENAKRKTISTEDISLFINVVSSATEAFTGFDYDTAESIASEMLLYEKKTYEAEGELSKTKGCFHFIYYSSTIGSEFIIYNTYLADVPETEKPESRPMYGDTTKIRTETVPTK